MGDEIAICFENLTKTFGRGKRKVRAVRDLNLKVQSGQVYGFLGPNGAGKSTTIRMMMDLIRPTLGSVYLFGQHVQYEHDVLERRVGALVEQASFYGFLSGRRNLEVLARTNGHLDLSRIDFLLEQVDLAKRASQRVKGYSTGMKQRLGLAAALLCDPDLIILDEPTGGLDPAGIQEVRHVIRRLVEDLGKTVFLSSHLLSEVEQVCDRVAIIDRGEIVREGPVSELLAAKSLIQLDVEPIEAAVTVLAERWTVSQNGRSLIVQASRSDSPEIVRLLTLNNISVYQVVHLRQTLEEYFLSVTRTGAEGAAATSR